VAYLLWFGGIFRLGVRPVFRLGVRPRIWQSGWLSWLSVLGVGDRALCTQYVGLSGVEQHADMPQTVSAMTEGGTQARSTKRRAASNPTA